MFSLRSIFRKWLARMTFQKNVSQQKRFQQINLKNVFLKLVFYSEMAEKLTKHIIYLLCMQICCNEYRQPLLGNDIIFCDYYRVITFKYQLTIPRKEIMIVVKISIESVIIVVHVFTVRAITDLILLWNISIL